LVGKAVMVSAHKGGVGKTLVACNIALELTEREKKVGLVDADISSSNVTEFMKIEEHMKIDREIIIPGTMDGLKVFSMSLLVGPKAVSMDGAQYAQLLEDAINFGEWDTDYFVVDMPSGSSDEFKSIISVFQENLLGTIVVTQPAHTIDATRVISLHQDLGIPIIGLIENMSYFKAGAIKYPIFGESTVDQLGEKFDVDVLGRIPLTMDIRKAVEKREPKFKGEVAEPIKRAVDKILTLKPKKPSFLERLVRKTKELLEWALVEMVLACNKEIDIFNIQRVYGYPGGRVIRLNLMDEYMREVKVQADFMIWNGRLVAVENPRRIDCRIDIKPRAFAMAILGNRALSDGSIYDLETAWRMGDCRIWGAGQVARGMYFFKAVWRELRENKRAIERLKPLLERLI